MSSGQEKVLEEDFESLNLACAYLGEHHNEILEKNIGVIEFRIE